MKTKYVRVLSLAVKFVETCTYVLSLVLGFTTLGVLHEYGGVCNLFLCIFLQVQHAFLVKCISRTCVMYEEMFVFRFFPSWVLSEDLLRLAASSFRISRLALIPVLVL